MRNVDFKKVLTNTTTKPNTAFLNELQLKLPKYFVKNGEFDIEKFRDNLAKNNVKTTLDSVKVEVRYE